MIERDIVEIDESLCDGCGLCIPNCVEGALQIVEGKARLVSDNYCDGLGACLGHCPRDAIRIITREATPFDEEAVQAHLSEEKSQRVDDHIHVKSALNQWPVQLNLVSPKSPFFNDSNLLVLADCVPLAYPNLHTSLMPGKSVVIGCPKFDDAEGYAEKLSKILEKNRIRSITVAHMEVPCCSGLNWVVNRAVEASGKTIPVRRKIITVKGEAR